MNFEDQPDSFDGQESGDVDAVGAAGAIGAGDIVLPAGTEIVTLPPGTTFERLEDGGRDLIIVASDGTRIVVTDGVLSVPQIIANGVTVPPQNIAQLLEELRPDAGGGVQSSGGNFADDEGAIQDAFDLGDLLPFTTFGFPEDTEEEIIPFNDEEPEVVIQTPNDPVGSQDAVASVDEAGLPERGGGEQGEPAGTDEPSNSETTTGTVVFDAPDGLESVTINGQPITSVGQTVTTPLGTLTITSINLATGEIGFNYTLEDNTLGEESDVFDVVVEDADGDQATAALTINIVDDAPIAADDVGVVPAGSHDPITGDVLVNDVPGADGYATDGAVLEFGNESGTVEPGSSLQGEYGVLTLNPDGTYTYVRDVNTPGGVEDTFTYTIVDQDGSTSSATLVIEIGDAPDAITLVPRTGDGTVVEEGGLPTRGNEPAGTGEIADNDADNNSDPSESTGSTITFNSPDGLASVTLGGVEIDPENLPQIVVDNGTGTLVVTGFTYDPVTGDGTIDYEFTLDDNTSGDDTSFDFEITVTDLDGDVASDTLTITVVDDEPEAEDDSGSQAEEDAPITVNVFDNDTPGADDVAPGTIAVVEGSLTGAGTLVNNGDGTFTYTPAPGEEGDGGEEGEGGTVSFDYTITDGDGDVSTATVTIDLLPDSTPEIGINELGLAGEETVDEAGLPARGDEPAGSDEASDSETASGIIAIETGNDSVGSLVINGVDVTNGGTVSTDKGDLVVTLDNGVYSYTYTLTDNTLSDPDTDDFTLELTDSDGDTASTTLTINIQDDVPEARDDSETQSEEDAPVTVDVFANDTPGADGVDLGSIELVPGSLNGAGTLVNNGDGTFTYTPGPGEEGTDDGEGGLGPVTFDYTITDGDGDTSTATVTINLLPDSTPEIGINELGAEGEELVDEAGLPARGTEPPGSDEASDSETVSGIIAIETGNDTVDSLVINGTDVTNGGTITTPKGELVVTLDSGVYSYTYTLTDNTLTDPDSDDFTLTVTDSDGDTASTTLAIIIADDTPTAEDDANAIGAGEFGPVGGNVLGNDTEGADGADVTSFAGTGGTGAPGDTISGQYGTLTIAADGTYSYTRNPDTPGGVSDTFTYTITDGDGDTATANLVITIADAATTLDLPVTGVDDGTVVDEAGLAGPPAGSDAASDSEFTSGTFTFTAPDGPATVTIDGVAVTSVGQTFTGAFGTLTIDAINDGSIDYTYELTTNTSGDDTSDTFDVRVTDSDGDFSDGTLEIDIIDDVPTANPDSDSVTEDGPLIADGNVLTGSGGSDANATDGVADVTGADGATVSAVSFGTTDGTVGSALTGAYGSLTLNADGSYSYELDNQNATVQGLDSTETLTEVFDYVITDGDGDTATTTLTITINGADDPVVLNGLDLQGPELVFDEDDLPDGSSPDSAALTQSGSFTVTSADGLATLTVGGVTVFDGSAITFPVTIDDPTYGLLTITGVTPVTGPDGDVVSATVDYSYELQDNSLLHTGANEGSFTDSFPVVATDTDGSSDTDSLDILIVDDTPTANPDSDSVTEDGPVTADGNVLTGSGGTDANATDGVADVAGADGATVTAVEFGTTTGTVGTALSGAYGTLTLNADGSYSYELDNSNPLVQGLDSGETLTEVFDYTITDGDGDTDATTLTITINGADDGVTINGLDLDPAEVTVDEDDLADGSSPDAGALTQTGSFTISGPDGLASITAGGLTVWTDAGGFVAGQTVTTAIGTFEITDVTPTTTDANGDVTEATVTFSYTLDDNTLTHSSAGEDTILESFAITATDTDGSSDNASVDVLVIDDIPDVAAADLRAPTLVTDDTDIGTTGDTATDNFAGQFTTVFGADGPAAAESTVYALSINGGDGTDSGLNDTLTGEDILLRLNGDTVEGYLATSGDIAFTLALNPATGDITQTQLRAIEHDDPADPAETEASGAAETLGADLINLTATVTDGDGDTDSETIDISGSFAFEDDGPTATDNTGSVQEGGTTGGNVLGDDDSGSDGFDPDAAIIQIDSVNQTTSTTTVDTSGNLVLAGEFGTLTINVNTGVYTYDSNANAINADAQDVFTYTIVDGDGDEATATLTIDIADVSADVSDNDAIVNEAGLPIGSDPTSDSEIFDIGQITVVGAAGTLVYNLLSPASGTYGELDLDSTTGEYTYTLLTPFTDAVDENGPNVVNGAESFNYEVRDTLGNLLGTGSIDVSIIDDVPTATDQTNIDVAEDAVGTISGNVVTDGTPDTEGADSATVTAITVGGVTTDVPQDGTDATVVTANGTYTIDQDGNWTFDPNSNLDQSGGDIDASFTYTLTDGDGDFDTAIQPITITDGEGPTAGPPISLALDDSNLADGSNPAGPDSASDTIAFTPGSDDIASIVFGDTTGLGGGLDWVRVSDTQITGSDGGRLVVTIDLSVTNNVATVTATLNDNYDDHPLVNVPDVVDLGDVDVVATDIDGDTASATVSVSVDDDEPTITASEPADDALTVDETDLGTDATADFSGLFTPDFNADNPGTVGGYTLGINAGSTGLVDTATDEAVVLVLNGSVVEGRTATTNELVFTVSVDTAGVVELDQIRAVEHPVTTDPNDPIGFAADDLITLSATVTDSDGDTATATANIAGGMTFLDDGPSISNADLGSSVDVDETDGLPTSDTSAASVISFTPDFGADGDGGTAFTLTVADANSGLATAVGDFPITLVQTSAAVITGQFNDGGGVQDAFTVTINPDGTVTLNQIVALEHLVDGDNSAGEHDDTLSLGGKIDATVTITDGDGDTASATVAIGSGLTFFDDGPSASLSGADIDLAVSDTTLATDDSASFASAFTFGGGEDGLAGTSYALDVSSAGADSGIVDLATGEAVLLFLNGGVVEGRTSGTDEVVFTVSVDAAGNVTLDQQRVINHALSNGDGTTASLLSDDLIQLTGTATDNDGDTASATLEIGSDLTIGDAVPTANPDSNSVLEGGTVNSISGVLANDDAGADAPATVTGVAAGDTGTDVSGNLNTGIPGTYGTLTLQADGSYVYQATPNSNPPSGAQDVFTYTITDADGDTSTSTLTISINDVSLVADDQTVTVNEAALDLVQDGDDLAAGTVEGSNPTSTDETVMGQVTVVGTGVTYALNGSGTGNNGVITLDSTTGEFTYTLTSPVDGPDANDGTNTELGVESFQYTATDANGNTVIGTITVDVIDDVPVAQAASITGTVDEDGLTDGIAGGTGDVAGEDVQATGSVTSLFTPGADIPLTYSLDSDTSGLPSLTSGGVAVTYSVVGDTLTASAGADDVFTFTLNPTTGAWTFTLLGSLDHATGADENDIQIELGGLVVATDGDGDQTAATGSLLITVDDDTPVAEDDTNSLSEDTTSVGGNILTDPTADGFGADGAGSITTISGSGGAGTVGGTTTGTFGTLDLAADGTYTYNLDTAAVQGLDDGETEIDTFTYTIVDADGDSSTATLTITINGANDAPVANADTNWTIEDAASAITGNVLQTIAHNGAPDGNPRGDVADVDVDIEPLTVTTVGTFVGTYGTLTLNSDGSYSYELDNNNAAVQALDEGDAPLTDSFNYTASDGDLTDSSTLTISIFGTNDAPVVGTATVATSDEGLPGGLPDTTGNPTDTTNSATANGTISITDVDDSTFTVTLSVPTETLTSGGETITWSLSPDGKTLTGSTTTAGAVLTVVIDDTGAFTVTQSARIDHADTTSEDVTGFTVDVNVNDGTTTTTQTDAITVNLEDDSPEITSPIADEQALNDPDVAPLVGDLNFAPGGDGPGTDMMIMADVSALTAGGDPLLTSQTGNVLTAFVDNDSSGTLTTGDLEVFTITVDPTAGTSGTYTFDLLVPLDPEISAVDIGTDGAFGVGPSQSVIVSQSSTGDDLVFVTGWEPDGNGGLFTGGELTSWLGGGNPDLNQRADVNGSTAGFGLGNNNLNAGEFMRFDFGPLNDYDGAGPYTPPGGTELLNAAFVSFSVSNFGSGDVVHFVAHYTDGTTEDFTLTGTGGNGTSALTITAPAGQTLAFVDVYQESGQVKLNLDEVGTIESTIDVDIPVSLKLTDGDGDPVMDDFVINIFDDAPDALDDLTTTTVVGQDINAAFVLDFSGSISNSELNLQLNAVKDAAFELFETTTGSVGITLITFSGTAQLEGSFSDFAAFAAAIDDLNNQLGGTRSFSGQTDFTAAIQEVLTEFTPSTTASNQVFFLSDGNPNEQTGTGGNSLLDSVATQWQTFINDNDINVTAIGVGGGINTARLQDVDLDGDGTPILADDFEDLIDTLIEAVTPPIGGNVLDNDTAATNGIEVTSITVSGVTYFFDGVNTITPSSGSPITGTSFTATTSFGGELTFDFSDGSFTYEPPAVTVPEIENFQYTVADGDGDTDSAILRIDIAAVAEATNFAKNDVVITNSGSTVAIDEDWLLSNDNAGTTIDSVGNADSGSVSRSGGTTTFVDSGTDAGGSFTYAASNGTNTDNAFVTVNREQAGESTLDGTSGDDILIGRDGANDDIDGGDGADIMFGGTGSDDFIINDGDSNAVVGGTGDNGTISGFDTIVDFNVAADDIDFFGTAVVGSTTSGTNGTDSTLTIGGQTVKSHAVSNGIITFDDQNTFSSALTLSTESDVAAVVDYLQSNDIGASNSVVAFTVGSDTYVYFQDNGSATADQDSLVKLEGVTLTNVSSLIGSAIFPVVLDLDGDGVEFVGVDAGVSYDYDGDGNAEATAWVGADDAILAFDANGDGTVTDASEFVFGGEGFTDLDAVAARYDDNGDGVLDASDSAFADFGIWQDADQDGVADAGEFTSLADAGIVSIGLVSDEVDAEAAGGDVGIFGSSTFTFADGSTGIVADTAFATGSANDNDQNRTNQRTAEVATVAALASSLMMGTDFDFGMHDSAARHMIEDPAYVAIPTEVAAFDIANIALQSVDFGSASSFNAPVGPASQDFASILGSVDGFAEPAGLQSIVQPQSNVLEAHDLSNGYDVASAGSSVPAFGGMDVAQAMEALLVLDAVAPDAAASIDPASAVLADIAAENLLDQVIDRFDSQSQTSDYLMADAADAAEGLLDQMVEVGINTADALHGIEQQLDEAAAAAAQA